MNRADRRRREAQQGIGHGSNGRSLYTWLDEGKAHQQAGRFAEAEQAYGRALSLSPDHPEALHLMGLLSYRLNRLDEALEYLAAAIERQPSALYCFNLGVISQKAGRWEQAIAAYEKALALNPRHAEAHMNLGNVLRDRGRPQEAIESYRRAEALNPSHPEIHNNLGVALQEFGHTDEAIASFRRALALKPTHVEALNNLGLALMEAGTLRDATEAFQRALTVTPDYQKALYNLGVAWSWAGDDDKAVQCLQQVAKLRHDHGQPVTEHIVYRSRLKHDIEQMEYLRERRLVGEEMSSYIQSLHDLRERFDRIESPGNRTAVAKDALTSIAPSFNRILYCMPPSRMHQGALNPSLDVQEIQARYYARQPEVTYIDGLLTDEALNALRRFCWEATIWKKDYENGYSGAFLGDGFASPLLFQIAEELRLRFPRI
ncbi:MAG TPA: tetratricopeptide repeat protein, partial [Nitrospira sp.]|nr:tetratricopeptide repeat protein [Nitrospira sp.]